MSDDKKPLADPRARNPEDYNRLRQFLDQLHELQLVKAKVRNRVMHEITENWTKKCSEANKGKLHVSKIGNRFVNLHKPGKY